MIGRVAPLASRLVTELVTQIERRWRAERFAPERLAAIACAALGGARLHETLAFASLVDWTLDASSFPETCASFEAADAPVFTLFANRRLAVNVHVHPPSVTTIHDHDFDGAVASLEGNALYETFAFASPRRVAPGVLTGRLQPRRGPAARLLAPGAVEPVHGGKGTIHRVWHLSDRTCLLVVRTRAPNTIDQHQYFATGAALQAFGRDHRALPAGYDARSKMLGFLGLGDPAATDAYLARALSGSDPWSTVVVLLGSWDYLQQTGALEGALRRARLKLGRWIDRFAEARRAERRLDWEKLRGEDERLTAALLRVIPDRRELRAWASTHAPRLDVERLSKRRSVRGAE